MIRSIIFSVTFILITATSLFAQKQKLNPEDYGQWQYFTTTELSPSGQWFAYNIELVDGDGWLIIKNISSGKEYKFIHGVSPEFSQNSKWAAFRIGVSEDKQKKLKEQDKKVHYKLGLMNLSTAQVDTFGNIQSFEFSENGKHLVMQKYKPEGTETESSDLILRDLSDQTNQLIGNVGKYAFNEQGTMLAVQLEATQKLGNGVHIYNLSSDRITVLDSDTTAYSNLSWNDNGTALAFLKAWKNEDFEGPSHQVYVFRHLGGEVQKQVFSQSKSTAFPDSFRIVDYRPLSWAEDNETVFFGIQRWKTSDTNDKKKEEEADSDQKDDLEPSNVEVWHWKDDAIQPRQEVMAEEYRRDNHLVAWHLGSNKFVQLGSEMFDEVRLTGNQEYAVGYNPHPYEPTFEEEWRDIYLIDVKTGEYKKILDRHERIEVSPDGNYLLYFKDQNWWTYDIKSDKKINLTQNIDTRFEDFTEVNGRENARPFGNGQWAEDGSWFLAYDQYGVYKLWSDGSKYEILTPDSAAQIRYRQIWMDLDEEVGLENDQPIYFSIYGDFTKKRGFARITPANEFETLVYDSKRFTQLSKADSTDFFIYRAEAAANSPDFFYVNESFSNPDPLTNTNPQQENYYWADDELITFTNKDGEKLQGRLLYPANYEPGKKYPMITYIYEERSQTMHSYSLPSKKSAYNFRRYSSEGYFVFQPDITYELRDPGVSAIESVVPAVQKMISTGMINKEQIGLTGHSWGAYQTTFIITQTDLFNSAVAGAPLTNMISMYNSIYWNSGTPDANIFEVSQGRFPEPWWKDWDNYVENSPIFNAQDIDTPLLVEFGTDDGAVDFNQGVELYTTMRRMQNPFVMLVYEGENHGLARDENEIDYATRAFQWHEHFLLGKEPADWIVEGLQYLDRPAMEKE